MKDPLHVTGLIPPGSLAGTWKAKPLRNVLPARPDDGTVVCQTLFVKTVVAETAAGSKVMYASGTVRLKSALVMVWPVKWIVTGVEPSPFTFNTLLNQMKSPLEMAVPLKLDAMDTAGHLTGRFPLTEPLTG